jgi:hypothetical protein
MRRLLLILFLLTFTSSFSQEVLITGRCINKKRVGISDVLIRVNQQPEPIYSDRDGYFSFPAKIGDSLSVLYSIVGDSTKKTQQFYVRNGKSNTLSSMN